VPEAALRPGDLVFYHAGRTHVGLCTGDGRVVHAPHPGATVRLDPVGAMPVVGAIRPV
jgi:peptidoglycan DL-endopeptidase CwlO